MALQREYLRGARRRARQTRDYFDEDEDDVTGSPSVSMRHGGGHDAAADEVDPLDAFMLGIDAQVVVEKDDAARRPVAEKPDILNQTDDHDSYLEELARTSKKPRIDLAPVRAGDSDDEVYATAKSMDQDDEPPLDPRKNMEVLAPLEHTSASYEPFRKQFYTPHPDVAAMMPTDVAALRKELSVRVEGADVPSPVQSFMQVGFDRKVLAMLMKLGLEAPTAIQSQAFPVALSGRDLIGIAKTGSGKTLAFTLPMVRHVMDQRELSKDEGPIAVVLSPTRELAHQIFGQAKKFLTLFGAECAAVYGGVGKWEQIQALKKGAEVVVATPGRLIEMIRKKTARMTRVTFVVLDEADRMFEMGFESQLRSIMGQIRPDRQTLMFSATFRRRVEALALDVLANPVKIMIGQVGQANEDIRQIAIVLANDKAKWPWLMTNLRRIASEGRVLIFASSKVGCEELTKNLNAMHFPSRCLHGDKTQPERTEALAKFKSGECQILVATDVAARGLDVKDIKNVVNFDVAKNIDTHVHRIGRTGRMGVEGFEPGTAYTLVTTKESQFASQLVYNMDVSGQNVPAELLSIAQRDPRFRRGVRQTGNQVAGPVPISQHHDKPLDDEDAAELKRWNESRGKSKADKRKGLGFGAPAGVAQHLRRGTGLTGFVMATNDQSSTESAFRSGFVKASTGDSSSMTTAVCAGFGKSSPDAGQVDNQPVGSGIVASNELPPASPAAQSVAVASVESLKPTPPQPRAELAANQGAIATVSSDIRALPAAPGGVGGESAPDSNIRSTNGRQSRSRSGSRRDNRRHHHSSSRGTSYRHSRSRSRSRGRYRRSRSRSRSRGRRHRRRSRSSSRSSSSSRSRSRSRSRGRSRSRRYRSRSRSGRRRR